MVSLVLMVGQSNMVGNRIDLKKLPDNLTAPLNAKIWHRRPAAFRPLVAGSGYQKKGVGPEIGFAHEWADQNMGDLAIVKAARDGASLFAQLDPERPGGLYKRFIADTRRAMVRLNTAPSALVWMQGEIDARSDTRANSYASKFHTLIRLLDAHIGAAIPVIICGRVSGNKVKYSYNERINSAFEDVEFSEVRSFETQDLKRIDMVHYNMNSLVECGRRAAKELIASCKPL